MILIPTEILSRSLSGQRRLVAEMATVAAAAAGVVAR
jgi:hypothetical protein